MTALAQRILDGDLRSLARAATLIESRGPQADDLMRALFPHTGRALILGITGAPGAGKSTLVDAIAAAYRACGKTAGIIAVDPSSPYTGGAILGDRIRMLRHHADPGVFIRSMATRGWMGGMARATTDMALLFDAAGRHVVIVETVGVGQDEVEIARLADVVLVVLVPGLGDDVQAIKAGIMEIADIFVINKSDLPGAAKLEREIKANSTPAEIIHTIAHQQKGIDELITAVDRFRRTHASPTRSANIWKGRLREMLRERILERLPLAQLEAAAGDVAERKRDPYAVVDHLLNTIMHGKEQQHEP